jgi:predicted nucleotidyltransferase component of viral defense system
LGLSGHKTEVLAVKLEVGTNPPHGAVVTTTALNRHVRLNLQHHDPASLFAGKLHAVLQRAYPKGRDIFDLWWYLSQPDWPEPNLVLLNAALEQTGWDGPALTAGNWRRFVRDRVAQLTWQEDVIQDIRAFIMMTDWEEHLTQDKLLELLA